MSKDLSRVPNTTVSGYEVYKISMVDRSKQADAIAKVDDYYGHIRQVITSLQEYKDKHRDSSEVDKKEDITRINHVLAWLLEVEKEGYIYVNAKPATSGCTQAISYRYDPAQKASVQNEIKSVLCKKSGAEGEIFYFIMSGENEINPHFLATNNLKVANLKEFNSIPYTLNPATVFMALQKVGYKKLNLLVDSCFKDKSLDQRWLYNNLGSRFFSCAMQQGHFMACLETLKGEHIESKPDLEGESKKGFSEKIYKKGGDFIVAEREYDRDIFQKQSRESDGFAQLLEGDYARYYRSGGRGSSH